MSGDLAALPVHELGPLLESRQVSPVEVAEAVLEKVETPQRHLEGIHRRLP